MAGIYGEDPPERGAFFSRRVIPKSRDSQVQVYERVESPSKVVYFKCFRTTLLLAI